MQADESSIHNRSYSFANWQNTQNETQHQMKLYYNYPQRNENFRKQKIDRMDVKDIPSFGDGPNCRKGQAYYTRTKSTNKDFGESIKEDQSKNMLTRVDDAINKANGPENWGQRNQGKGNNNYQSALNQSRAGRVEIEKTSEPKYSNIDKINLKIKKILDTLNEEQKKITQNQFRVGGKKIVIHPYANKIRNQHSSDFIDERNRSQENYGPAHHLYNKFVGIRERHKTSYEEEQQKNVLGEINANTREKVRKISDFVLPQQKPYKSYGIEQFPSDFSSQKKRSGNQSTKMDSNKCYRNESQNNNTIQTPFRLLNGTNVKSTDSLGMSSSTYLKMEKQSKNQYPVKDHHHYFTSEENKQQKKMMGYQVQRHNQHNLKYQKYGYTNNGRGDPSKQKEKYKLKTQPSYYKISDKIDGRQDITPAFSSFGQSRNKKMENTPQRNHSLLKHDRSEKSCKLSNGKDLDAEIKRIQKKIQDFHVMKKQLEDDQCDKCTRAVGKSKSLTKFRESRECNHKDEKQGRNSYDKCYPVITINSQLSRIAEFNADLNNSECTLMAQQISNENEKINEIKGTCKDDIEVSLPKPFKMSSRKNTKRINGSSIKEIESAFISQERFLTENPTIQSLITNICKQIQLDTNLRNSKKWFNRKASPYKWKELFHELSLKNIHTTEQQNKQIFTMSQQEDNPFYTTRDDEGSYNELIENFLASEKFWIENLQHHYSRTEIQSSIKEIDIEKKGTIMVEDMVRFINFESDKYYRNRDLSLIFRRLSGVKGQVTTEYILTQFCKL